MRLLLLSILAVALLTFACADPAANKTKATVGNAAPESAAAKPANAETLPISTENSKVEFVAAKVTRSHNGSFKKFSGTIDLVNNKPEDSRVSIDIEANSVETDEPDLTKHLQTPDFFDVAKYPKATFDSTKIEPGSNDLGRQSYMVTGNFELHGIKKAITFPATIQIANDKVTVSAEFSINRKDWNLTYPGKADDLIRDGVVIKLNVSAPRKK
ncbi:MAG TPA: YceI family protein [Pyrinomonadaceae bacterium]|nr:YceI family protein [Pyrinomonadaceae bacterium]